MFRCIHCGFSIHLQGVIRASHCFDSDPRVETEKGLFSQCLDKRVIGGIAKPYLTSYMGGKVDVKLNDGRCTVDEQEMFYHFRASRKASECGTERRVSEAAEKCVYSFTTTNHH